MKHRQMSHLNSQMAQLHANLMDFNDLIETTSNQFVAMEKLGKLHGALFMASHTVFEMDQFES
jgi:hypothetical protein